ncbi:family 43 glycosylhydrolase [Streptomyces sp. NPDC091281]|uniref:family 43 glycosylhydrolase n=1 Tax=Streptomyces sp. NPDC091281 TaxID=3365985 RepID=UPI00382BAF3A
MNKRSQAARRTVLAAGAATALALGGPAPSAGAADPVPSVANDTVWRDTAGDPVLAQGGNVLKVGSAYYWVGTSLVSGQPKHVNLYRSTDLETWTFEGPILSQSGTTGDLATGKWLGRPQLVHNPTTGMYVLVVEVNGPTAGLGNSVLFATSPTVDGTYTPGTSSLVNGYTMGDHSVFVDGDDAYLVYVGDNATTRNVSMNVAPLDADWTSVKPAVSTGWDNLREAPAILKKDSAYYMFASGKDWWNATATSYRTSTDLKTWSAWKTLATDPPSGNSYGTQFEQIIPVVGSESTSYLYNGDRYSQFHGGTAPAPGGIGRNAWYPLTFTDGVPTLHGATTVDVDAAAGTLRADEIANGRFDQDVAGTAIPQWSVSGTAGATKVEDTTDPGNRRLAMWSAGPYNAWAAQDLTLPNGTYTLSFDHRSSGGQTNAYVSVKNYGGPEIQTSLKTAQPTWATRTVTFTVTNGSARVGIWTDGPGGKWLNLDNVSVWRN